MFRLNHRSIKVTLFSEIHIKIISKISLTYHQIAYNIFFCIITYFLLLYNVLCYYITARTSDSILFHRLFLRNISLLCSSIKFKP